MRGDSWERWRIVLQAAYGLGDRFDDRERALFHEVAGRAPPRRRVKQLWLLVGRRGGKDSVASLIAAQYAPYADEGVALRVGERVLVACIATDKDQAGIVFNYIRGLYETKPGLKRLVDGKLPNSYQGSIYLKNNVEIRVVTNNFRAPRGRTIALAIGDEICFWRDDGSANPDAEVFNALRPSMMTVPDSMFIGISSVYRTKGLAYERWERYYGEKGTDDVLVVLAPSRAFNPTLSQEEIESAIEEDPDKGRAEYLSIWRRDLEDFVSKEVVDAAVISGRAEIEPVRGTLYVAFVDPSGGSADSMTMAIAHENAEGRAVLDLVREVRPPFSPDSVVEEFAATMKKYRINACRGDRYGGEWPRERFTVHGIDYEVSELTKSEIYRESLPLLNARRVELLDHRVLKTQLMTLERRTARGGRDSIDHAPGSHDDVANAALGALVDVLTEVDSWTLLARKTKREREARRAA